MSAVKVLQVFGRLSRGGAEMRTISLLTGISPDEVQVDFCSLSGLPGPLDEEARSHGGKVHLVPLGPLFPFRFLRLLWREDYDVVHSHVHLPSGFILFLAWFSGVPVRIAHFRNTDDGGEKGNLRRERDRILRFFIRRFSTLKLAVCEGAMQALLGVKWQEDSRARVLYNGISREPFEIEKDREALLREFDIPVDATLILHVGRMNPQKNHERLIDIFAAYSKKDPDARLLLAGRADPERKDLIRESIEKHGLEDRVHFAGERKDIPLLLKSADLLLFPSLWEGLPGAVLESLAAGTPVLSSDLPGTREIRERSDGLHLLPLTKSNEEWSKSIESLLEEPPPASLGDFFQFDTAIKEHCRAWSPEHSKDKERHRNPGLQKRRTFLAFFLNLAISLLSILALAEVDSLSFPLLCSISSLLALFSLGTVVAVSKQGHFSISSLYALIFFVFHFGLVAVIALGYDVFSSWGQPWHLRWLFDPLSSKAILLTLSGYSSLASAVCLQAMRGASCSVDLHSKGLRFPVAESGFAILALSVITWFAGVLAAGGPGLLLSSYSEFLEKTRHTSLMFSYFGIGLGLSLQMAGEQCRVRKWGTLLFAFWALIAFPLGLRGEVLFPLFGAAAVLGMRRIPVGLAKLLTLSILGLVLIALVRELRMLGVEAGGARGFSLLTSPLDALAEMGSSLRPVFVVLDWERSGESPLWGMSYWAPIERGALRLFPFWERVPSLEDPRLLNVLVQERVGTIGFSPIAEAYHNFRNPGPLLMMFLTGSLLGVLDRITPSSRNQALVALLIVPLLIQVRNAFSHVPGQVVVSLILLMGLYLIWYFLIGRHRSPGGSQ